VQNSCPAFALSPTKNASALGFPAPALADPPEPTMSPLAIELNA
jgi:hypothetical protein